MAFEFWACSRGRLGRPDWSRGIVFFSLTEGLCFGMNACGGAFRRGRSIGKDTTKITELLPSFPIDFPRWGVLLWAFILGRGSSGGGSVVSRDWSGRSGWSRGRARDSGAVDRFFQGANSSVISVVFIVQSLWS